MRKFISFFQKLPVIIGLCAFLLGLSVVAATKVSYKHWFNEGVRAYKKGHYSEARELFDKSRKANPGFSKSSFYYAMALRAESTNYFGQKESIFLEVMALKAFQDVIYTSNDFQEIDYSHVNIADIYKKLKEREQYQNWLDKRAELSGQPTEVKAQLYYSLAVSYWEDSYLITQKYIIPRTQPAEYKPLSEWQEGDVEKVRNLVKKGLAYIDKATVIHPKYYNSHVYRRLLKRELLKVEPNPDLKQEILEEERHGCRDMEEFQHLNREANEAQQKEQSK